MDQSTASLSPSDRKLKENFARPQRRYFTFYKKKFHQQNLHIFPKHIAVRSLKVIYSLTMPLFCLLEENKNKSLYDVYSRESVHTKFRKNRSAGLNSSVAISRTDPPPYAGTEADYVLTSPCSHKETQLLIH
jgi:hypothetical protein